MAKRLPPILVGQLKTDDKVFPGYVVTVWRLPSGATRLVAQKAVVVGKRASDGAKLAQMKLVDAEGNEV